MRLFPAWLDGSCLQPVKCRSALALTRVLARFGMSSEARDRALPAAASDMYTCPSLTINSEVQKNNKLPLLALTCGPAGDAYARLGCWFQQSAR